MIVDILRVVSPVTVVRQIVGLRALRAPAGKPPARPRHPAPAPVSRD